MVMKVRIPCHGILPGHHKHSNRAKQNILSMRTTAVFDQSSQSMDSSWEMTSMKQMCQVLICYTVIHCERVCARILFVCSIVCVWVTVFHPVLCCVLKHHIPSLQNKRCEKSLVLALSFWFIGSVNLFIRILLPSSTGRRVSNILCLARPDSEGKREKEMHTEWQMKNKIQYWRSKGIHHKAKLALFHIWWYIHSFVYPL